MRTITKNLANRLKIQAQEAGVVGFEKMASHLNRLANTKTRDNNAAYVYSEADLQNDVEGPLWDAVLRIADYYNCNIYADDVQENIEKIAEDLVKLIQLQAGNKHGVGPFEPSVLGEVTEQVEFEVE